MKKDIIKIFSLIFAVQLLFTGCDAINVNFEEGEGFSENTTFEEFEVVTPDSDKNSDDNNSDDVDVVFSVGLPDETEIYTDNEVTTIEDDSDDLDEDVTTTVIEDSSNDDAVISEESEEEIDRADYAQHNEITDDVDSQSIENADYSTIKSYSKSANVSTRAQEIVNSMSTSQKVAGLILARVSSDSVSLMSQYEFGGCTLYACDFENRTVEEATDFISQLKSGPQYTPFIAVDEEGGYIVRVSDFTTYRSERFQFPREIYASSGMDGIISDSKEKAELLTSLGINLNLAPVADIASPGDYIYNRTMGQDADTTADIIKQIVETSGQYGLSSCLKHFPGYGSNVDTHTGVARDTRSLESFRECDFKPFKSGISGSYTPAIMVNHNIIEAVDPNLPASLSADVHKLLRNELDFDGVIVTDDLAMDGVKAYAGNMSPYVLGILSGNDLLCVSSPCTAYNDIMSAVNDGTISEKILDEHISRVIEMKIESGII